jgi:phosphatidate cytidylyltransferase
MVSDVSPPAPKSSRAGRDLPAAVAVSIALLGIVWASLFIYEAAFLIVVAVAVLLAVSELAKALSTAGTVLPMAPVAAGAVAMLVSAYVGGSTALVMAMGCTVLAVLLWRMAKGPRGYVRDVTAGVFTAAYIPFLAGFVALLLRPDDGPWRVLTFIVVTISSDIGGFVVGVLLGRHLMSPSISPKKTWEGFAGSAAACMIAGWALVVYALDGEWWVGVLLGAVTVVSATAGDLFESLIKRDLGLKDMGKLLPGHGGIMDRLDSMLATVAFSWLLLYTLVPVS